MWKNRIYISLLALIPISCVSPDGAKQGDNVEETIALEEETEWEWDVDSSDRTDLSPLAVLPQVGIGKPKPDPEEVQGYQLLTWDDLRNVRFEKKYYESEGQYFDYPTYGETIQRREGESVYISGYLLPVNPDSNSYVLSAYTFSSCFFCGQAGPESILELMLEKKLSDDYVTDQWIAFKGSLRLNANDLDHLYYILDEAVEVELE